MTIELKIRLLHNHCGLPMYAKPGDAGLDLYAIGPVTLGAYCPPITIPLAVAIQLPEGYEGQIRPRSSLSRRGIHCALGTIDSGYTGEIACVLWNCTDTPYGIQRGDRICQLVIAPVARAELVQVESLNPTPRGGAGWGSSGV